MRSIVTGSAARGSGGAIPIFTRLPVGLPVYVRVRGGTDVQWTRVIAVVMITVRPESARMRHSRLSTVLLLCRNFGPSRPAICTHTFGHERSFSAIKNGDPKTAV